MCEDRSIFELKVREKEKKYTIIEMAECTNVSGNCPPGRLGCEEYKDCNKCWKGYLKNCLENQKYLNNFLETTKD